MIFVRVFSCAMQIDMHSYAPTGASCKVFVFRGSKLHERLTARISPPGQKFSANRQFFAEIRPNGPSEVSTTVNYVVRCIASTFVLG